MVAGIKRYLSLPAIRRRNPQTTEKPHPTRSTSLPSPSHPSISHLHGEIHALRSWLCRPGPTPSSTAWLSSGLDRLARVLSALSALLRLPQSLESICRSIGSVWINQLLEDSLRLADAHGRMRSEIIAVRELQLKAQIAIRRRDEARIASTARSLRRAEKDLGRIASAVRIAGWSAGLVVEAAAAETEMEWVVREAIDAAAVASVSIVLGIAAICGESLRSLLSMPAPSPASKKEEDEEWRFGELEGWMGALQRGNETVFVNLVNTRVLLLNALYRCY